MIKGFPRESEAAHVENVDVSGCSLADDTGLLNLTSLRKLNISNNSLTELVSLRTNQLSLLNASKNSIKCIPNGLTYLATLNLGHNANLELPERAVNDLTRLRALILNDCNLDDIGVLSSLRQISTLVLSSNSITDAAPLAPLCNLTKLSLSRNGLTSLPSFSMRFLKEFRVAHNSLMSIPALDVPALRLFDLGHNLIKSLNNLLPRVRNLNLRGNPVSDDQGYLSVVASALTSKLDVFDGRPAPEFPKVARLVPSEVAPVAIPKSTPNPKKSKRSLQATVEKSDQKDKKMKKKGKKKKKERKKRKAEAPVALEVQPEVDEIDAVVVAAFQLPKKKREKKKRVKKAKAKAEAPSQPEQAAAEVAVATVVIQDPLLDAGAW